MPADPATAGQFGPETYQHWRGSALGTITEELERDLILRLAGEVTGRSILDVGCGDGALTQVFAQNGASLAVGCDVDPRMVAFAVAKAAQRHTPTEYVVARAERLPFRNDAFDLVTVISVLAFVAEPELAVRDIARVMKPGGRLIIADPGKWSLWAAVRRIRGWLGSAPMWKTARFTSAEALRRLAESAGLRAECTAGAVYYPRSAAIARRMAPVDPRLGARTTFGAAFVAVLAAKPDLPGRAHVALNQGKAGGRPSLSNIGAYLPEQQ